MAISFLAKYFSKICNVPWTVWSQREARNGHKSEGHWRKIIRHRGWLRRKTETFFPNTVWPDVAGLCFPLLFQPEFCCHSLTYLFLHLSFHRLLQYEFDLGNLVLAILTQLHQPTCDHLAVLIRLWRINTTVWRVWLFNTTALFIEMPFITRALKSLRSSPDHLTGLISFTMLRSTTC